MTFEARAEQAKKRAEEAKKKCEQATQVYLFDKAKKCAELASKFAEDALREAESAKQVADGKPRGSPEKRGEKKAQQAANDAKKAAVEAWRKIDAYTSNTYDLSSDKVRVVSAVGFLVGFLAIFLYCFFDIKFFPSGLSFVDAIPFFFVALGLGLIIVFIIGAILYFLHPVSLLILKIPFINSKIKNKAASKHFFAVLISILILGFIHLWLAFYLPESSWQKWVFSVLIVGVLLLFAMICYADFKNKINKTILTFLSLLAFLGISSTPFLNGNSPIETVLTNLEIRKESTSVILSKNDFDHIQKWQNAYNAPILFGCDSQDTVIHNVDVLWQGIGDKMLLWIPSRNTNETSTNNDKDAKTTAEMPHMRTAIKSSDSALFSTSSMQGCITASVSNLFLSGESKLLKNKNKELNEILKNISVTFKNDHFKINKIEIQTFSDIQPCKKGNLSLSRQRADAIKTHIEKDGQAIQTYKESDEKTIIEVLPMGNFNTEDTCSKVHKSAQDLIDCRGKDRGVMLKFYITKTK